MAKAANHNVSVYMDLQVIPGIGKSLARALIGLGYGRVGDLAG